MPSGGTGATGGGLRVTEDEARIDVDAGVLRAEMSKDWPGGIFRRVWLKGRLAMENPAGAGHYLVDQQGRVFTASADGEAYQVRVERRGPLHTVVRADGRYVTADGEAKCRYIARMHFYLDRPFIRLQHTFLFTEDSDDLQLRDLGVRVSLPEGVVPTVAEFDADAALDSKSYRVSLDPSIESVALLQDQYRHLAQPESHWGLYVTSGGSEAEALAGERAGNWCTLASGDGAVSMALRNFWQEFPKELEIRGRSLVAHLWSSRRGGPLDFRLPAVMEFWGQANLERWRQWRFYVLDLMQAGRYKSNARGLAKTHEILYHFHEPTASPTEVARHFAQPPLAYPDPEWTASTDAVGLLSPRDPERFPEEEQALDTQVQELQRLIHEWGNYGWWEHGAGPHLNYRFDGNQPIACPKRYTGGCEYWYTRALWIGYLRSGDRRYFDLAAPYAKHFMDVIISHVNSDTRWRGDFYWDPGQTPVHWGGTKHQQLIRTPTAGVCAQFGWTVDGILYHYYLTGDDRAWDVVQEYADLYRRLLDYPEWVDDALKAANIMWSRKVFGILDELSILYEATGDETFARLAKQLAHRVLLPDEPGGIHREPQFKGDTKLYPKPYAIYYKTPCVIRYGRATGDPLAKETVLRMVKYDYETAGWYGYCPGWRYTYAWLYGGSRSYLACADHATRVRWDRRFTPWPVGIPYQANPSGSTLGSASLFLSMNAVMAARRQVGDALATFPVLPRYAESPAATILVKPDPDTEAKLEVHTTAETLNVSSRKANVQSRLHHGSSFHEISLPAGAAPDIVSIEAPARQAVHVLTCTGAKVALAASAGLPVAKLEESGPWFFKTTAGRDHFVIECADPELLVLRSSAGRPVPIKPGEHRIPVQPDEQSKVWSLSAKGNTFVKIAGIRPLFAYQNPDQLFAADGIVPESRTVGEERTVRFPEGIDGKGLRLGDGEWLAFPVGEGERKIFSAEEGTVEFWFQPSWPYFLSPHNMQRTLLFVPGKDKTSAVLNVHFLKVRRTSGPMAYDLRGSVAGAEAAISSWGRKHARWMAGDWVHLAIEWGRDRGVFGLRYYVNGQYDGNKTQVQGWRRIRGFAPLPIGDTISIGGGAPRGTSLNGTIDELRISSVRRYRGVSFSPARRSERDQHTLVVFRFESGLEGDQAVQARVMTGASPTSPR